MLKKLAKYGNSTTLVIDKAILELLNMNESSMVKLHTDGKSLIITPVQSENLAPEKTVSYAPSEALMEASNVLAAKINSPQVKAESARELAKLSDQDRLEMQKEMTAVFLKNMELLKKFHAEVEPTKEFQACLGEIAEKYSPVNQCEDYIKAFNALKNEFCPELKVMDEELGAINKKYEAKSKLK